MDNPRARYVDAFGRSNGKTATLMKALIAPHIDFNRGGPCFAWAYKALAESQPPDVFVVLGTGHSARQTFVMSRKDFETPFGVLRADRDKVFVSRSGYSFCADSLWVVS